MLDPVPRQKRGSELPMRRLPRVEYPSPIEPSRLCHHQHLSLNRISFILRILHWRHHLLDPENFIPRGASGDLFFTSRLCIMTTCILTCGATVHASHRSRRADGAGRAGHRMDSVEYFESFAQQSGFTATQNRSLPCVRDPRGFQLSCITCPLYRGNKGPFQVFTSGTPKISRFICLSRMWLFGLVCVYNNGSRYSF